MKKKFAIISTWNGEGYSMGENKLEGVFKFKSEFFAKLKCYKKMKKEQTLDDAVVFERENGFIWEFEDGDSGSYQAFEITDDLYGFVINVNVNEVIPCTKEEFEEEKTNALASMDRDMITEEHELEEKDFFIHTYGEYDKEFIKL